MCYNLSSVTINAITPPSIGRYTFTVMYGEPYPIYVPSASVNAYKAADIWKDYYVDRVFPIES